MPFEHRRKGEGVSYGLFDGRVLLVEGIREQLVQSP